MVISAGSTEICAHQSYGAGRDLFLAASPSCVYQSDDRFDRIVEEQQAICGKNSEGNIFLIRYEPVGIAQRIFIEVCAPAPVAFFDNPHRIAMDLLGADKNIPRDPALRQEFLAVLRWQCRRNKKTYFRQPAGSNRKRPSRYSLTLTILFRDFAPETIWSLYLFTLRYSERSTTSCSLARPSLRGFGKVYLKRTILFFDQVSAGWGVTFIFKSILKEAPGHPECRRAFH